MLLPVGEIKININKWMKYNCELQVDIPKLISNRHKDISSYKPNRLHCVILGIPQCLNLRYSIKFINCNEDNFYFLKPL